MRPFQYICLRKTEVCFPWSANDINGKRLCCFSKRAHLCILSTVYSFIFWAQPLVCINCHKGKTLYYGDSLFPMLPKKYKFFVCYFFTLSPPPLLSIICIKQRPSRIQCVRLGQTLDKTKNKHRTST
jgi:hypothetical protein